jgi:hypothetical protein
VINKMTLMNVEGGSGFSDVFDENDMTHRAMQAGI